MIWQNIFPTNETDVAKLEERYLEKSDAFLNDQCQRQQIERFQRETDRQDFRIAIAEMGFTEEQVKAISENEADLIPDPDSINSGIVVASSAIAGQGVFATRNFESGDIIGWARMSNHRTPIGRFCNHSTCPNAAMIRREDNVQLMATRPIHGCRGGQPGEEITVSYRQVAGLTKLKEELCPRLP
jgi:hypothetical protein